MIELGEHLGLVWHMINAIGVPYHLQDEAFSEGLVVLAVAGAQYDEKRGVPVGAYLAQRLRWGLKGWLRRERDHPTVELTDVHTYTQDEALEARRDLDLTLYHAARKLNINEYLALLGLVYGVRQDELAHALGKNASQLGVLRDLARAKLNQEMRLL